MRAARPAEDVSLEEWQADHDAALGAMEKRCDPAEPVKMHCEVQVVTETMARTRHKMHEVYKVVRAENGAQLYGDAAKPGKEVDHGTDLVEAAMLGRIVTVKRLLGGDIDGACVNRLYVRLHVNRQRGEDGATALYCAAQNGHFSVVLILLEHGADPNIARIIDGGTPMITAARKGHVEVVALLLAHNADPNKANTADGQHPTFNAAQEGHLEVVALLLKHNADPNKGRRDGCTSIYIAAKCGHIEVGTLLLKHNADPNQTGNGGQTPLYMAAYTGNVEATALLLKHSADPTMAVGGTYGTTPLWTANHFGHAAIADMLRAACRGQQQQHAR